jgi:hypothetical protein
MVIIVIVIIIVISVGDGVCPSHFIDVVVVWSIFFQVLLVGLGGGLSPTPRARSLLAAHSCVLYWLGVKVE